MPATTPKGGAAVMARRKEPPDSLDFFPSPPWSTRALLTEVLWSEPRDRSVWEPACGEGHMSEVLKERFSDVLSSDVFDYGYGDVHDFLSARDHMPGAVDWVITNPPFKTADQFTLQALAIARVGVALLVRTAWLEGGARYRLLFERRPPQVIAQFAERVPMVKGRWDPNASSATAYCWVVWQPLSPIPGTRFIWIPPGRREALTRPSDAIRFAVKGPVPLLETLGA